MPADASAYAALGLEPGADAAAIESAYKRLIKLHHPDRHGGDAHRAAEINRAYFELRYELTANEDEPVYVGPEFDADWLDRRGGRRMLWLLAAVAVAAVLVGSEPARSWWSEAAASVNVKPLPFSPRASEPMEQPLDFALIDGAMREALHLARTRDEMALAERSRECHHRFRMRPSLDQLDRCAAFDNAVLELQDRDPLRDGGPFSELAVTGRQMSAASTLSADYLSIDSRLDQIRLRVQLGLAQILAPPPPAVTNPAELN